MLLTTRLVAAGISPSVLLTAAGPAASSRPGSTLAHSPPRHSLPFNIDSSPASVVYLCMYPCPGWPPVPVVRMHPGSDPATHSLSTSHAAQAKMLSLSRSRHTCQDSFSLVRTTHAKTLSFSFAPHMLGLFPLSFALHMPRRHLSLSSPRHVPQ